MPSRYSCLVSAFELEILGTGVLPKCHVCVAYNPRSPPEFGAIPKLAGGRSPMAAR